MTVHVTEADLLGKGFRGDDCAGFRAVKRVVPNLVAFGWWTGTCSDGRRITIIGDRLAAANKLISHAQWQVSPEYGAKAEPFSFEIAWEMP